MRNTSYYYDNNNGLLYITILISALLILCHFLFSNKNNISLFSMFNPKKPMSNLISNTTDPKKIVVFDLDETLGSFGEISIFWDSLEFFYGTNLFNEYFYDVLDIFPEFLRPDIINILNYLKDKKKNKECDQIMIYTNNQGPKTWVYMIRNYFNDHIGCTVFDKIIAAFKIKGKIIEFNRTSHNKSVDDLINCTKIKPNTEICFIDDQYHPLMKHENVYYINVKPYNYTISYQEMAERYYEAYKNNERDLYREKLKKTSKEDFIEKITNFMKQYNFVVKNKNKDEIDIDKIISKKIVIHLEEFFKKKYNQQTRKRKNVKTRTTRKNI
jgi:hypothetical protein